MNLSTVIGKPVLSPQGEALGYVKTAYLNRTLSDLSSLGCIDDDEEEFYLSARAITAIGDAVIAKRSLRSNPVGVPCPIGNAAYSSDGKFLGAVADYSLDGENSEIILRNETSEIRIPAKRVAVGETAIIYPEAAPRSARTSAPKRAVPKSAAEAKEPPAEAPIPSALPAEDTPDRFNLLGKRVKIDVLDAYGTPIARAGETITPSVIRNARQNNLLLRLAVNTLTNLT